MQNNKKLGYFIISMGILQFVFYTLSKIMENDLSISGLILPILAAIAFIALGMNIIRKAGKE